MIVDVAIVGSGPAGGAAAALLAESGLKVIVLEQAQLPRPKACGGLVPASALAGLPQDLSQLVRHEVSYRKFRYRHGLPHLAHTPDSLLALVDRAEFDAGILQLAMRAGRGSVTLREGFRVREVTETGDRVTIINEKGERVVANYLIAADGAASRTARCLGLNCDRVHAVGIDSELAVTHDSYQRCSTAVEFDYFCLAGGYGWVFPKGDGVLSVGVASWQKDLNCKAAMAAYIAHVLPESDILNATSRAHPIPAYAGQTKIASNRVCLVGDAASLVDPVTGEGIQFALNSGLIAARTVIDLLSRTGDKATANCHLYQQRVYRSIGEWLGPLHSFATLPFRQAPEYYYRRFVVGGRAKAYQ